MNQVELLQGSPEWSSHRATHYNASDAAAMMGESPHRTRTQLLHEVAAGITQDIDSATQRRFDDGNHFETLARPLAERIIGKKLYPVVGVDSAEGKLSASFDGLTMDGTICFEHKTLNAAIRAAAGDLPMMYLIQMEQQLAVSGAEKCLFMATTWNELDELVEETHFFYVSNPKLRQCILAGWKTFEADLAGYQHVVHIERPLAEAVMALPALFVHARGGITSSNMEEFGEALAISLAVVRGTQLVTDQDFSNAEAAAKLYRETGKKLMLAKEAMLAQTVTIGAAARMIDAWHEDLRVTALNLEKNVLQEKDAKKMAIMTAGWLAYAEHIAALEATISPIKLNFARPNFISAIKGRRLIAAWNDAVDTELAISKVAAGIAAKDVREKLFWCKENAAEMSMLFPDLQQIITKPMDDFTLLITSRIKNHADKLEAERSRIQAEEEAKARTKVEAAAQKAPAVPAPVEASPAQDVKESLRAAVVDHQNEISAFLASRDFGKDSRKIRAVLVEFVKFQSTRN